MRNWHKFCDLLKEKHRPIADKFASDAGISLMNQDAKITERKGNRMVPRPRSYRSWPSTTAAISSSLA